MNLLIGGDVVPEGKTENLFLNGNINDLLGDELYNIWNDTEYKIFNLETPLTNTNKKIDKYGPSIKCNPNTINGLKKMNPSCIMLANNHILDYTEIGLKDTIKLLNDNKLNWIGVGNNIDNIKKSFLIDSNGKKVAIYNCCETEFSIASDNKAGANPYNQFLIGEELGKLKKENDYLIVIYHGGKEHYRYPSPNLQKRCHYMVDNGADLIICQHSHCIGCYENYEDSKIIYGQGNFIFNRLNNEFWNTSLLINIDINNGFNITYIPIVQTENGCKLASDNLYEQILNDFKARSKKIKNKDFINKKYNEYANEKINDYIVWLYGNNLLLKIIKKFFPKIFNMIKFKYTAILNILECDSHNELFSVGLKNKINEKSRKDEK